MKHGELSLKYVYRDAVSKKEKPPLLLLLHGIGSHEEDLFGLAPFMSERFFVASARAPFALAYGGFAWFELFFTPEGISINLEQAKTSRRKLLKFIEELAAAHGLDADKVFLCGFSQGAIMSYAALLTAPEKLSAVVAMSGRVVTDFLDEIVAPERLRNFPLLIVHGTFDTVLPIENGRQARDFFSKFPVALDYREYAMAHQVSAESLADVAEWLQKKLDE
jgi:phospholipase/carboxylesterase